MPSATLRGPILRERTAEERERDRRSSAIRPGLVSREGVAPSPPASETGVRSATPPGPTVVECGLQPPRWAAVPESPFADPTRSLVGDPRLALSLFLFPKQVGRYLPMSPMVRPRGFEPPCLSAPGSQPGVSTGFHHSRERWCPVEDLHPHRLDVSEASCYWKNRTQVDAGLRVARSLRAYETREATAPALPQRSWWAWEELHLHAGGHPLLRRACLLVPPQARLGGSGRSRTSKDPEGSTALEAAASAGCATEPENVVFAGRRGPETACSCGRELATCE